MPVRPDRETFRTLARDHRVIPVMREIDADWWTPVAVFHLLASGEEHAFLLESVEGGERLGRYSFVGRAPWQVLRGRGERLTVECAAGGGTTELAHPDGPLAALGAFIREHRAPRLADLPPFASGAVGCFGYDTVRWIERLPDGNPAIGEDDLVLLFLRDVLAFDHVRRRLTVIANAVHTEDGGIDAAWENAVRRLDATVEALHRPLVAPRPPAAAAPPGEPVSSPDRDAFCAMVEAAKEHIRAGDIFQVVLSRRFTVETTADDLALYRALRAVNPSPYMFLLRLGGGTSAVGSSPEPLLKVRDGRLTYRPIAGTMPRSGDDEEDRRRAERLLADPKERAEHVMLVDLGRNDLGRCAVTGSVRVDELMAIEKYSHVLHIVSGLSAELRPGLDPLDALYACFPAGTVSGAPKVRAMEIIEALEPRRRGLYAGAVGYVDLAGNLDTCIALRTMIVRDGVVTIQAGAGIVADSDPVREFEETGHKAAALLAAVRRAGGGDA